MMPWWMQSTRERNQAAGRKRSQRSRRRNPGIGKRAATGGRRMRWVGKHNYCHP